LPVDARALALGASLLHYDWWFADARSDARAASSIPTKVEDCQTPIEVQQRLGKAFPTSLATDDETSRHRQGKAFPTPLRG
jgi:hypothetical protein